MNLVAYVDYFAKAPDLTTHVWCADTPMLLADIDEEFSVECSTFHLSPTDSHRYFYVPEYTPEYDEDGCPKAVGGVDGYYDLGTPSAVWIAGWPFNRWRAKTPSHSWMLVL